MKSYRDSIFDALKVLKTDSEVVNLEIKNWAAEAEEFKRRLGAGEIMNPIQSLEMLKVGIRSVQSRVVHGNLIDVVILSALSALLSSALSVLLESAIEKTRK